MHLSSPWDQDANGQYIQTLVQHQIQHLSSWVFPNAPSDSDGICKWSQRLPKDNHHRHYIMKKTSWSGRTFPYFFDLLRSLYTVPQYTMYCTEFIGPQSFVSEFHWRLLMNHRPGRLVNPALWMLQCMSHAKWRNTMATMTRWKQLPTLFSTKQLRSRMGQATPLW